MLFNQQLLGSTESSFSDRGPPAAVAKLTAGKGKQVRATGAPPLSHCRSRTRKAGIASSLGFEKQAYSGLVGAGLAENLRRAGEAVTEGDL